MTRTLGRRATAICVLFVFTLAVLATFAGLALSVAFAGASRTLAASTALGAALALGLAFVALLSPLLRRSIARLERLHSLLLDASGDTASAANGLRDLRTLEAAGARLIEERAAERAKAAAENAVLNESVIALLEAVHRLSSRDLTAKAPVTEDIVGAISDSVNQLAHETAEVLIEVNEIAAAVAHAALEVKTKADQVSETAHAERDGLANMIDVLSRASESMQRVALLAYNSNKVAGKAGATTDRALETVTSAVSGMSAIRGTIADVERRIKRLGGRSHEIGQIVSLINTISERTHVLALNASMQAAIAGEAGRGFAVVAEEVQRLAESSRQATERIERLIYNIQIETNDAIAAVTKTMERMTLEAEAAEASGARMQETRETTAQLIEMVGRISSSAEEQMAIATQLRARIDEIGAGNERSGKQLAAQHAATATLLASADKLVNSVRVFKLPAVAVE